MANQDCIDYPHISTLTRTEIEYLADRLYGRGTSALSTSTTAERADLVLASRVLRRLLAAYEHATNRQLSCILLAGGR